MYDQDTGEAEYAVRLPIVVGAVVAAEDWLPVVGMIVPVVVLVEGLPDVPAEEGPVVLGTDVAPDEVVKVG